MLNAPLATAGDCGAPLLLRVAYTLTGRPETVPEIVWLAATTSSVPVLAVLGARLVVPLRRAVTVQVPAALPVTTPVDVLMEQVAKGFAV